MFKKIHVYDLDGVLVDTSHRYRNNAQGAIDLVYWYANRYKVAQDKLLPLSRQFISDCNNPEIYTILCTAREQHIRDIAFIVSKLAKPNKLIMRPKNNETPDSKLKRMQLVGLFNLRQFANLPRRLWEDNRNNINALQDIFTECFFVQSHIRDYHAK